MKRSKFSLSHYKLLTANMGSLVPLTWYEALPGDSIQQSTSALIRVSPLLAPVMHPVRVRIHHWFVPNRLLWDDWEEFITGGPDGTSVPIHPYISANNLTEGCLCDYLGVATGALSAAQKVSALPVRAYNLIYNEHYRDQDLITPETISTASGVDTTTNIDLLNCAWEKDYFTTARPWEQKGDEVTIPIGDSAPVTGFGQASASFTAGPISAFETDGTSAESYANYRDVSVSSAYAEEDPLNSGYHNIRADLSQATGISINDLRLALSIQRYQEARAQYGSRYVEYLRYLGIKSSDARLQNPEYLGGGRQTIQFSEVLQTAEGTDPVGEMKGHGISAMRTNKYRRYFEEHGIVMTFMSVVPKAIYTTGLDKAFSRTVKEDYFQKELQYLGEQEIPFKEVQLDHTTPDGIFGYQQRYDEYRYKNSNIAGEFRSSLDHWHYARKFAGDIALNQSFTDSVPTKRVNASSATDSLYIMANHSIQARRMLQQNPKPKTF